MTRLLATLATAAFLICSSRALAQAESEVEVVGDITMGQSIDEANRVYVPSTVFFARDTIHASVETIGIGVAVMKARWTYRHSSGKPIPVIEESATLNTTGPATTAFRVSKATPWPIGQYRVEILLNDKVVRTKAFIVQ